MHVIRLMIYFNVCVCSGLSFLPKHSPSSTSVLMAPSADTLLITTLACCTRGECLISKAAFLRCAGVIQNMTEVHPKISKNSEDL